MNKQFFCYGFNPDTVETENKTTATTTQTVISNITNTNYQARITASSLRIRQGASTSYKQIGSYPRNSIVTIYAVSNNWGKTDKGWICLDYTTKNIATVKRTVGQYKRFARRTTTKG